MVQSSHSAHLTYKLWSYRFALRRSCLRSSIYLPETPGCILPSPSYHAYDVRVCKGAIKSYSQNEWTSGGCPITSPNTRRLLHIWKHPAILIVLPIKRRTTIPDTRDNLDQTIIRCLSILVREEHASREQPQVNKPYIRHKSHLISYGTCQQ